MSLSRENRIPVSIPDLHRIPDVLSQNNMSFGFFGQWVGQTMPIFSTHSDIKSSHKVVQKGLHNQRNPCYRLYEFDERQFLT